MGPPFSPLSATYFFLYLKSIKVEKLSSTKKTISPPFPPSPPSGPPALIYFSRRNDTAPSPPSPALIVILALSTNILFSSIFPFDLSNGMQ